MELELIIREILSISRNINNTYNTLMDLSSMNLENSKQFSETLEDLDYYFTEEDNLYNNLDINTLKKLLIFFDEESKYSDDASRGYDKLDERYYELLDEIEDMDSYDEDYNEDILDNYYEEVSSYIYKYRYFILNNVYIMAIKNMIDTLHNIKPNNIEEKDFIRILKNSFKVYKYEYLTTNTLFEKFSLRNKFNPLNMNKQEIPIEYDYLDSIPIYYNETLRIIDLIYDDRHEKMDDELTLRLLFLNNVLDILLTCLDYDRLNIVENYIFELDDNFKNNFYGKICLDKIKTKKKEL